MDVLSGTARCLSKGQLIPSSFRQDQNELVAVPGGKTTAAAFSNWVPVLLNAKRGFLMSKVFFFFCVSLCFLDELFFLVQGDRRRWKSFEKLTPQRIRDLESQLMSEREAM